MILPFSFEKRMYIEKLALFVCKGYTSEESPVPFATHIIYHSLDIG